MCSYLLGFRNDYRGNICYDNCNVRNFDIDRWTEVRRQHISLLFQELRLFPELTALENVKIKNQLTGHKSIGEIKEWFEQLGIADKMQTPVGRMSFGQQQRVALMRSLAQPFDFLLADEAVSHLDEQNARIVGELMTTEARKQGAAILATRFTSSSTIPAKTTAYWVSIRADQSWSLTRRSTSISCSSRESVF